MPITGTKEKLRTRKRVNGPNQRVFSFYHQPKVLMPRVGLPRHLATRTARARALEYARAEREDWVHLKGRAKREKWKEYASGDRLVRVPGQIGTADSNFFRNNLSSYNLMLGIDLREIVKEMLAKKHGHGLASDEKPKIKILDIACGEGRALRDFQRSFGTENVFVAGCSLAKHLRHKFLSKFYLGDFEKVPIKERFDLIILNNALDYSENPAKVIRRTSELLEVGGMAAISLYGLGMTEIALKSGKKGYLLSYLHSVIKSNNFFDIEFKRNSLIIRKKRKGIIDLRLKPVFEGNNESWRVTYREN